MADMPALRATLTIRLSRQLAWPIAPMADYFDTNRHSASHHAPASLNFRGAHRIARECRVPQASPSIRCLDEL
jgi:hypothetical protein